MQTPVLSNLKVNHMTAPIGTSGFPLFSWELQKVQLSYRLILTLDERIVYDSGMVLSKETFASPVLNLSSATEYEWLLTVRMADGETAEESSRFETAFVDDWDFSAGFITMNTPLSKDEISALRFKKSFHIQSRIQKARLYIVGLGSQRTRINGHDLCRDDILTTPTTNYNNDIIYNTYDITSLLVYGDNMIDVTVGNGFFNDSSQNAWNFADASWRDKPMLKAQLIITYEEGEIEEVITDHTWLVTDKTPIVYNNFRMGITYDSRIKALDSDYVPAVHAKTPRGKLYPLEQPPVRIVRRFAPVASWQVGDKYIFDAGINTSGFCMLRINGRAGQRITLSYGERLNDDKTIDMTEISEHVKNPPLQVHTYICSGNIDKIFLPDFTYCGFRYIEVSGLEQAPAENLLEICEIHQDIDRRGSFSCSNELINKIEALCIHSAITNYHWIPTDCPHREKNGWTGDAQLSAEQFMFHFDAASSYLSWLRQLVLAQNEEGKLPGIVPTDTWGYHWGNGPAWDAALFILPQQIYLHEGTTEAFRLTFPAMERYLGYVATKASSYIVGFGLGDWCPPNSDNADGFDCPVEITDTAYYYQFAKIAAQAAEALSLPEKAKQYTELSRRIKDAFLHEFVSLENIEIKSNSQTAYAAALYHKLIPPDYEELFAHKLFALLDIAKLSHTCGILGYKYIFKALSDNGYLDTAYQLAISEIYPSIGLWIKNGATSLYETWQEHLSLNHHMYSSISDWFYQYLGGMKIIKPGCAEIIIRPELPEGLDHTKISYHSCKGEIIVEKTRLAGGKVDCHVSAPEAVLYTILD